ncbi:carbamoyltransferase HypF [Methylomonas sp. SURF-2]|uniref:Carbamoyltransferase HypF n=1 Tax=Methylomonas subterranea TaxID=2952225 RepID=A0ABT1TL43_9GAMM|nr:carbamoyltransferase HypF [Methylomonas sp. SURF-2]MCQ8106183.1 carbamoyltransferase HypF [Methylomonas sp. SURF-2]
MPGKAIRVRGVVQGVGFRPMVWRLARQYDLTGSVWNDSEGVLIHVYGSRQNLADFIDRIPLQLPPLASLTALEVTELASPPPDKFRIVASHSESQARTPIAADAATCPACLADIADPNNRRYRYPFANCTHCGPRLSIVRRVPYDRCHTSMAAFAMCPACQREYDDPADRRFHAQANCCPACGPSLWLEDKQGRLADIANPIEHATELLRRGYIVAIKGLGGFHLACIAADGAAVDRLRQRKRRYAKPFALMAKDLAAIRRHAAINDLEQQALLDKAAPIVLLQAQGEALAAGIAPGDDKLGFMLPYTPLHSLLLAELEAPIVLTSGNLSDEPQCIANDTARKQLADIADYWLLHDREIVNRLDDSVVREMDGEIRLLRRARGYSPQALSLPAGFAAADGILAMGAELKNSFCLLQNGSALVSQHVGDLESAAAQRDYRNAIGLYRQLCDFHPRRIALDRHPGYLSSQYGLELAAGLSADINEIQHHHAHLAACLAEHGIALQTEPVLAAIFDGLGMGDDGTLWGGEFLLGDYRGYSRLAHFQPIALPGGTQAMREPWRNTYAQLRHYFDWPALQRDYPDLAVVQCLSGKPLATLDTMINKNLNAPLSGSCGRWFDAFGAALGLHTEAIDYEGQAAIALETLAATRFTAQAAYPEAWSLSNQNGVTVLGWQALWRAVLNDLQQGIENAVIAARIHHSLIEATVELLMQLSRQTGTDCIVLGGGVFQNRLLLEGVSRTLRAEGKSVLAPQRYPPNDGGLALGQAAIAAAKSLDS